MLPENEAYVKNFCNTDTNIIGRFWVGPEAGQHVVTVECTRALLRALPTKGSFTTASFEELLLTVLPQHESDVSAPSYFYSFTNTLFGDEQVMVDGQCETMWATPVEYLMYALLEASY
jgi:hypothetical protein